MFFASRTELMLVLSLFSYTPEALPSSLSSSGTTTYWKEGRLFCCGSTREIIPTVLSEKLFAPQWSHLNGIECGARNKHGQKRNSPKNRTVCIEEEQISFTKNNAIAQKAKSLIC